MQRKRVVVTGGCGFIGSAIVRLLIKRGYSVRVVDNLSKSARRPPPGCDFVQADLADRRAALESLAGYDLCVNLAAKIGGIGYFHKFPATILSENNKIYSNTFESAVQHKYERMIYFSSSMVFESAIRFPSREIDLKNTPSPMSAYGFSKLSGEFYCHSFWQEFRLPFTILRPFNAFGPNEIPEEEIGNAHAIPDLIRKVLQGQEPIEILGDGEQTRCFTHVDDIAEATLCAIESPNAVNEDFNIGTDQETRIIDLAKMIWKACGKVGEPTFKHIEPFKFDIRRRVPDVEKARRLLGWQPKGLLQDRLPEVVAWIREANYAQK